jgi:UDP:flavonoid glycosyltransferase YjiC (YdhE family)
LPFFPALYDRALAALAGLPIRVLLTLGRDADPDALGPLPANAHAETWLVQDEILPHAAVVVSHGGYGTTLGALAHGVPLAKLPGAVEGTLTDPSFGRTAQRIGREMTALPSADAAVAVLEAALPARDG